MDRYRERRLETDRRSERAVRHASCSALSRKRHAMSEMRIRGRVSDIGSQYDRVDRDRELCGFE
jgi:hypothetical protein